MYTRIAALIVLALMLVAGGWKLYIDGVKAGRAQVQQAWDADKLQASEAARAKEQEMQKTVEGIDRELQAQKSRNAALSRAHAVRLREYETALSSASAEDSSPASGTDGPFAQIARECGRALTEVDAHARELAGIATGLQRYAADVCVSK